MGLPEAWQARRISRSRISARASQSGLRIPSPATGSTWPEEPSSLARLGAERPVGSSSWAGGVVSAGGGWRRSGNSSLTGGALWPPEAWRAASAPGASCRVVASARAVARDANRRTGT